MSRPLSLLCLGGTDTGSSGSDTQSPVADGSSDSDSAPVHESDTGSSEEEVRTLIDIFNLSGKCILRVHSKVLFSAEASSTWKTVLKSCSLNLRLQVRWYHVPRNF